jgi:hypothetical protein
MKTLSKLLTSILSVVKTTVQSYCDTLATVTLVLMIIFEVVVFQGKPVYRKFGSNCTAASVNLSCFYIRTKVFDLSMPLFLTMTGLP